MSRLKNLVNKLFSPEQSTEEQLRQVIKKAEEFDKLVALPGWEDVLRHMGSEVNGELIEGCNKKYDRESRLMHCDMWQAKRELLDSTLAYIESMQAERDRILEQFKGKEIPDE